MTTRHKANSLGAAVGKGGLSDQMAARMRQDGETVGGDAINSTSIFDPVLAELLIRWFSAPGMWVLDPFAGGSVRGIVTSRLGRHYHGVDLRAEQIQANYAQAGEIRAREHGEIEWDVGDAEDHLKQCKDFDMVLTCPPYADLEVYSDDPRDISNMPYAQFFDKFSAIMGLSCKALKPDRFFCLVVGDARGKDGAYYGFPAHCVAMMQKHGLKLWNEQILVTPAGSLPTRTKLGFTRTRKTGRSHQSVLVFLKGDAKRAVEAIGECDFGTGDPLAQLDTQEARDPDDDPLADLGTLL